MYGLKRSSLCVGLFCLLILLSSCAVSIRGVDDFGYADCTLGLTAHLIPPGFLSMFNFIDGDYFYYDLGVGFGYVKTIMYLQYEKDVYEDAKQYCINTFALGETIASSLDGYTFIENLTHNYLADYKEDGPSWVNLFAYDDSSCTLLFLGYYNESKSYEQERELAVDDFPEFLKEVYTDCFDK